jgi:hypothetical protein
VDNHAELRIVCVSPRVTNNTTTQHNTSMQILKIVSKRKAHQMLIESLFNTGGTLTKIKLCSAKYKAGAFPVGREIEVGSHVKAVWSESRSDSHGKYSVLYCLY